MTLTNLPCDWCQTSDPCRFQWLDDSDLPCVFCRMRCMENYIFWQLAQRRSRKLTQIKTESERHKHANQQVRGE